ncbi:hypothetical protein [Ideonella sp. A 288]|uniref:hypothetical protein n=1 Tax=Ideonella sp. A 288 TaxID=1962181 RepID=UPI000B4A805C|nr:hypothetical protein [Ideonella sp. A 288]
MKIKGQLRRITDIAAFAASWQATGGKPTAGHAAWGKARVHLATDVPTGQFEGGFVPPMSLKADTDSAGRFGFEVPDGFKPFRGQVVAFQLDSVPSPFPGLPPLPVLSPLYRCAPFKFSDVSVAEQQERQMVYIFPTSLGPADGISQAELDDELGALRKSLKLDKLRATITSSAVDVRAEKDGGDVRFKAHVRGSTSADLGRLIEAKAGEIDIDLPGPDFIVGLCVSKDDIEAGIRKGMAKLSKKVSQRLIADAEQRLGPLASLVTLSVRRSRHVQTGVRVIHLPGGLPDQQVPVFTIVGDPAIGLPRKLY